mgnify:CR=1 FL=1
MPKSDLTACLAFEDGTVFYGHGFGAQGDVVAELCFNTAMTGYQEIITDPSYTGQIVCFTFPHVGNVGIADDDSESKMSLSAGLVVRWNPTEASNWRAKTKLSEWLVKRGLIAIGNIDTRCITRFIRDNGSPHVALTHNKHGYFNEAKLIQKARNFKGLKNSDLAGEVTCQKSYKWEEPLWGWPKNDVDSRKKKHKVVALDYGVKENILRSLVSVGCNVTVLPATSEAKDILALKPDGVLLSNGPGDPKATGTYVVPTIREILSKTNIPIFGICLGHQMLALALGAKTVKMKYGHHGANHPVKNLETGRVEITSMNHGFSVDSKSLPDNVLETHTSLFDGSNCGLKQKGKPIFSVQFHPEASPGPQDSHYLFKRFAKMMSI